MVLRRRLGAVVLAALMACTTGSTTTEPEVPGADAQPGSEADVVEQTRDHAVPSDPSPAPGPEEAPPEELDIDGVQLSLTASCDLVATFLDQRREHHFDFPGECHFAPDPQEHPAWIVPTDHGKAVLVVGSEPAEGSDCDTALQVLVVTEKGPALSSEVQRVAGCGPGPWDEMMYHVMASRHERLAAE